MKRKEVNAVMLGLGWMASLGVVFVLGILSAFAFHLGPGADSSSSSDLTLEQRELMLIIERYTGVPADISSIMSVGSGDGLTEQMENTLRAIMRSGDRDERAMDAERLARGLPSRKVMAAIKFLQEIPPNPGRNQVLGQFLESWASEDGRRAVAFASSLSSIPERELATQAALRGWSKDKAADAWAWVVDQAGNSRRAERWLEVVVSSLSADDSSVAFQLLEQMAESDFRHRMAVVVMDRILQSLTPREAIAWLGEFPASSSPYAAAYLAVTWATAEPEAAARWMRGAFPGQIAGMGDVLREWVYVDPEAAAEYAWRNYSGEARRQLMDVVSDEWIANDGPAPLAGWLNTHGPDSTLDGAIALLALSTAEFDPATALVWAQSVFDLDERSMLEILIGRQWIRSAPDEAAAALPVLLESESSRAALLEPVEEVYYSEEDLGLPVDEAPLEDVPAQ
ncbi:MAG: hypothetical protein AB3N64_09970 [Puniceicoccaceae bacterium]